ncbi:MAG: GNAT family N-acetyltransferase [Hyphomicrobiaceae bacterium]
MRLVGPAITVDPLAPTDLAEAHALTMALRWPHRLADWQTMLDLGEGIGVRDVSGALVGTALIWRWGASAATVGLILVRPDVQGRGIGRLLVERLIALADGRALRLHATEAGVKLYEQAGFRREGLVRQVQGVARSTAPDRRVRAAVAADHDAIVALDAAAFGAPRARLVTRILFEGRGFVTETAGVITGFAGARAFGRGNLIGPVSAADVADAEALVSASVGDGFNRIDVTSTGDMLCGVLAGAGLQVVDTVVVMTRGAWPATAPSPALWALASQALG